MLKLRLERGILQREYLPRDQVEQGWIDRVKYFKAGLEGLGKSLAPRIAGVESSQDIQGVIDGAVRDVLWQLSRPQGLDGWEAIG